MAKKSHAAVTFIFITVVLDMLALGVIIPVLPRLVMDFMQGDTARAAAIYGLFGTIWAFMHFFFSPVLGHLSDSYGRRPVILLSNVGLGLDYVLMALAPSLAWLFIGRLVSGITASSITAANAYIADVTPPEKRAAAFGMIGAAFGLGFVLGPAVGGLLGGADPRLPFWVAAALSLINAAYGLFVLPESLPKERRVRFNWRHANPVGSLQLLRSRRELLGLAGIRFLSMLAHVVLPSTFVLYTAHRYQWDEKTVGLTLAFVGISSMIVQAGLIRPAVSRLGERRALIVGLFFGAIGFAVHGWAPTGAWFLVGTPLVALWGLAGPAAQSMMSRRVGPSDQGQLQGANSSLMGIAELVGPGIFTMTFATFISQDTGLQIPGAAFYLGATLLFLAALLSFRVARE